MLSVSSLTQLSDKHLSPQKQQAGVKSSQLLGLVRQISTSATKITTARRSKKSMERTEVCVCVCVDEKEESMVKVCFSVDSFFFFNSK